MIYVGAEMSFHEYSNLTSRKDKYLLLRLIFAPRRNCINPLTKRFRHKPCRSLTLTHGARKEINCKHRLINSSYQFHAQLDENDLENFFKI